MNRTETLLALMKAESGSILICGVAVVRKNGGLWISAKHGIQMDSDELMNRLMQTGANPWVII